MRITLVRHGETTGQSSVRYYGATDVPLNDLGRAQMRCVRDALGGECFDAAFSSRLSRSRDGARIVTAGVCPVEAMAAFDEVDFGRWEGWTREEIAARDPEEFARWRAGDDSYRYPGGESRLIFGARVGGGLREILARHDGGHLLMVLHRGVIAMLLAELLGLDRERRLALGIDLASIHVVSARHGRWGADCLNRTDHLAEPRLVEEPAHRAG